MNMSSIARTDAPTRPAGSYRLPWSLTDNVLGWLEPTKACNLYCEGCYSKNDPKSHKTIEQVRADLDVFKATRKMDTVSIAGGEPLLHPDIVEIVRIITEEYGQKAVINTNGLAMTAELCRRLADAGLTGFTFHVDSSQHRPGWKGATELELIPLREQLAQLVADVGGMSVAFNCTVFPHTLEHVPALVDWAREHIETVHTMVFILFRTTRADEFAYYANGRKVETSELVYHGQETNPAPLQARDVIARIREVEPDFAPSAYLGGTVDPDSFKWLLSGRIGSAERTVAWVGPRYQELIQTAHHAWTGRYLAYVHPELLRHGRSMLAAFAPFDGRLRVAAGRHLRAALRAPWRLAERLHFQSILIIQPIDHLADGRANMCDGCPDMTVHDGQLVWSCRLDELRQFGCFLDAAPQSAGAVG